jgi:hypothetical protein
LQDRFLRQYIPYGEFNVPSLLSQVGLVRPAIAGGIDAPDGAWPLSISLNWSLKLAIATADIAALIEFESSRALHIERV